MAAAACSVMPRARQTGYFLEVKVSTEQSVKYWYFKRWDAARREMGPEHSCKSILMADPELLTFSLATVAGMIPPTFAFTHLGS